MLLALKRQAHHALVLERFAPDATEPEIADPVVQMAHQPFTRVGRALYAALAVRWLIRRSNRSDAADSNR
jgi:hypothetical protein